MHHTYRIYNWSLWIFFRELTVCGYGIAVASLASALTTERAAVVLKAEEDSVGVGTRAKYSAETGPLLDRQAWLDNALSSSNAPPGQRLNSAQIEIARDKILAKRNNRG